MSEHQQKRPEAVEQPAKDRSNATRRNVLRGLAVTGVGAAAGVAMAPRSQAATGESLVLGKGNYASNITYVQNGATMGTFATSALTVEPTMFWIDNRTSTIDGNGIRGDGHGNGIGVWGHSDFTGAGVHGTAGTSGIGVKASGGRANAQLLAGGSAPRSRSDAHDVGEIVNDSNGDVWCCVVAGSPGQWRKIAGPSTAGAFHVLPAPARAYDSRTSGGALTSGSQRNISLATGLVGGVPTAAVPANSSAATVSVTITGTTSTGFLSLFKAGVTWPGNSNLNWFANGQTFAVTTVSAVNGSSQLAVRAGGAGSTHVIIDVIGYYT